MLKFSYIKELVKGTHNDTQHQDNAHPKSSPIDCDGVQLKYTFDTRQERITVSYHPTHRHGHTNFWYVYVS